MIIPQIDLSWLEDDSLPDSQISDQSPVSAESPLQHGFPSDPIHAENLQTDHYQNIYENGYQDVDIHDDYGSTTNSPFYASNHDTNDELNAYQNTSPHHISLHSANDTDDTVYHDHSGTVYHEHYWKKPTTYMGGGGGGGGSDYDRPTAYVDNPNPDTSCIDNNNNGVCDNAETNGGDCGDGNDS